MEVGRSVFGYFPDLVVHDLQPGKLSKMERSTFDCSWAKPVRKCVQSDSEFFVAYFTPHIEAGSPFQLAGLEPLFATLLAVFFFAASTLARVCEGRLERVRFGFAAVPKREQSNVGLRRSNWFSFMGAVDGTALIGVLGNGTELIPGICKSNCIIFTRNDVGTIEGFALDELRIASKRAGDSVWMFEERAA